MSEKDENLPEDLIHQILLRLPVKSLLRFKCVCKSWLSLISDPHFAKSHFDLAAAPTQRLIVIVYSGSVVESIDLEASLDDHHALPSELNFMIPTSCRSIYMIMGSCRGFLLLLSDSYLLLWNPSTGVHKQLSILPASISSLVGFGYDESTDDYLVISWWYHRGEVDVVTHVYLFSLRANSWRKIEGTHLPYRHYYTFHAKAGAFLNGALHWLVCYENEREPFNIANADEVEPAIIAFDLKERNFTQIPLPDGVYPNHCSFMQVLGGCLCLTTDAVHGFSYPVEIWVMKAYKVQSSWTKSTLQIPIENFSPACFNKSGDLLGIGGRQRDPTGLVKCNGQGVVQEYRNYPYGSSAVVYTESLLSLPDDQQ